MLYDVSRLIAHSSPQPAPGSRQRSARDTYFSSAYVSIRQHTSAYVSIHQHTSAYVSAALEIPTTLQHTSAYVSIRQHTSAYVSAALEIPPSLQHTSAYVSICQHTSAYVSAALEVPPPPLGPLPLLFLFFSAEDPRPATTVAETARFSFSSGRENAPFRRASGIAGTPSSTLADEEPATDAPSLVLASSSSLHTSAYVRIRPHTSAYVRQHTSAYDSRVCH
jgi:hypothetical protein